MTIRKNIIVLFGLTALSLAGSGAAQDRTVLRPATPSSQAARSLAGPSVNEYDQMLCNRMFAIEYTTQGIAILCTEREQGQPERRMLAAIDHENFPGGPGAIMRLLTSAKEGIKAKDGTRLWVIYRAPTQKARALCNEVTRNDYWPCQQAVRFEMS